MGLPDASMLQMQVPLLARCGGNRPKLATRRKAEHGSSRGLVVWVTMVIGCDAVVTDTHGGVAADAV